MHAPRLVEEKRLLELRQHDDARLREKGSEVVGVEAASTVTAAVAAAHAHASEAASASLLPGGATSSRADEEEGGEAAEGGGGLCACVTRFRGISSLRPLVESDTFLYATIANLLGNMAVMTMPYAGQSREYEVCHLPPSPTSPHLPPSASSPPPLPLRPYTHGPLPMMHNETSQLTKTKAYSYMFWI